MFIAKSFGRKVVATLGAAVGFVFVLRNHDPRLALRRAAGDGGGSRRAPPSARRCVHGHGVLQGRNDGVRRRRPHRHRRRRSRCCCPSAPSFASTRPTRATTASGRSWTRARGAGTHHRSLLWSCHDALKFGRRSVQVNVLRLGWNPQNSEPGMRRHALPAARERERAEMPIPGEAGRSDRRAARPRRCCQSSQPPAAVT